MAEVTWAGGMIWSATKQSAATAWMFVLSNVTQVMGEVSVYELNAYGNGVDGWIRSVQVQNADFRNTDM